MNKHTDQWTRRDPAARYRAALKLEGYEQYPLSAEDEFDPESDDPCRVCGSRAIKYERFVWQGEARILAVRTDCGYFAWREIGGSRSGSSLA